ncbi:MAG: polymorphic toxin type 33 domain-containing protein, partial [bacterium]
GRFTSPDEPLAFADFANPQSWNLYSYGYNKPILYSDPDGHEPCGNGVNPENGNFCVVGTASKPKVETQSSPIGPLIIPLLVTTVQIVQKTQELVQPVADWFSRPRNPICTAGYTALRGSIGFWAGGGLGTLGLAGGPTAAATIPGGAAGGAALGGAIGGFGGLVLCSTGSGGGSSSGSSGSSQDKKLSSSEVKKLEQSSGESAHQIKTEALGTNKNIFQYDLYKDTQGNVLVKGKGGVGEASPTGLKVN